MQAAEGRTFGSRSDSKACIPQSTNLEEKLAYLPIYLAACQRLVILLGPSWTTRVWCVLELFTFLQMGASEARVKVRVIEDDAVQVSQACQKFNALVTNNHCIVGNHANSFGPPPHVRRVRHRLQDPS